MYEDYFNRYIISIYADALRHEIRQERATRIAEKVDHTDLVGYAQALVHKGARDV